VLLRRRLAVLMAAAMMVLSMLAVSAPASAGLEGRGGGAFVTHDPCTVHYPGGETESGFDVSVFLPNGESIIPGCNTHTNGKHKGWLK
jgi:hypothetical protein